MTVATKSSRTLQIDGMSGEDCCKKVTSALDGVSNVSTHNVKVGSAKIEASDAGCKDACRAIDAAGFKAHESQNQNQNDQQKGQKQGNAGGSHAGSRAGDQAGSQMSGKADRAGSQTEQKNQPSAQTGAAGKPASGTR